MLTIHRSRKLSAAIAAVREALDDLEDQLTLAMEGGGGQIAEGQKPNGSQRPPPPKLGEDGKVSITDTKDLDSVLDTLIKCAELSKDYNELSKFWNSNQDAINLLDDGRKDEVKKKFRELSSKVSSVRKEG